MAAPVAPFVRPLYPPSSPRKTEGGPDVIAVKRGASRAGLFPWRPFDDAYNMAIADAIRVLQRKHGIKPTGAYGKATHEALRNTKRDGGGPDEWAFDAEAVKLFGEAHKAREKPSEQKVAEDLLAYCGKFSGPYVWGGEHDGSVLDDNPASGFDCSSSSSAALAHVGLLGSTVAHISGWFETWGEPGRGRFITVHAASDHVWIEFTIPGLPWARFDTSPHGDGGLGPRVRHHTRDASRFVARHPAHF